MKKLTRAETASYLLSHDNYVILTHVRPDGDTVGSAARPEPTVIGRRER